MKNIQVFIQPAFASTSTNIYIIEEKLTGFTNYRISADGEMIVEEIANKDELSAKPFLKLPNMLAGLLFTAILKHLENKGIKTKDENLIEGKLLATEEHLKDMREMSMKMLDALIAPPTETITEIRNKK
jgi:hypothetical protein